MRLLAVTWMAFPILRGRDSDVELSWELIGRPRPAGGEIDQGNPFASDAGSGQATGFESVRSTGASRVQDLEGAGGVVLCRSERSQRWGLSRILCARPHS